ncbi:MAG: hypothetical protein WCT18_03115 [Patescibacteria group bacterium]
MKNQVNPNVFESLAVSVDLAVWPLFFCRPIGTRFIGQNICFALLQKEQSVVVVYPTNYVTQPPKLSKILDFIKNPGRLDSYSNLRDLPISIEKLQQLQGYVIETITLPDGHDVIILFGSTEFEELPLADSMLMAFSVDEEVETVPWPKDDLEQNYCLLFRDIREMKKKVNYFLLIKEKTKIVEMNWRKIALISNDFRNSNSLAK